MRASPGAHRLESMESLEAIAGIDATDPEYRLALDLARGDRAFLRALVQRRRERMTQQDVADRLGITQASVAAFERYDNDPKLSTIRRYAQVVGVMVDHQISEPHWVNATLRSESRAKRDASDDPPMEPVDDIDSDEFDAALNEVIERAATSLSCVGSSVLNDSPTTSARSSTRPRR